MTASVCLCVCHKIPDGIKHISETTRPIFANFFAHGTYVRGSVLRWRRCDMLGTSGFTDDVTFAHNVRAYVAATKGRALKVTPEVAAPGGRSLR